MSDIQDERQYTYGLSPRACVCVPIVGVGDAENMDMSGTHINFTGSAR